MSTRFKIDYNGWSDEASPIKDDVKVKTSHAKLTAQMTNSLVAKEWRKKNPDKAKSIAEKGGNKTLKLKIGIHNRSHKEMSEHAKSLYKQGKGMASISKLERKRLGKEYGKKNLIDEVICEKCGRSVNKGNYAKSHGKKCKELDKINLINLLPNKFTQSITKEIAEEHGIKNWKALNIFHDTCPYTKCIVKVDRPNQFNPSWYGKNKREINKILSVL
jgi:hypothetical protein